MNTPPAMEGTHTVLILYAPIRELSNISLYFPKRRAPCYNYKSRAPHSEWAGNDHDWGKDDLAGFEQRGQSSRSAGTLLSSRKATKEAVTQLCWLAAEHHQLLVDLLSLCKSCAIKVKMGNQDGKLQDSVEGQEVPAEGQVFSRSGSLPAPAEQKRAASKSKRQKKLGGKKLDSAEDYLHSKMKKKVLSESSHNGASTSAAAVAEQIPGVPPAVLVSDSSVTGSYVSAVSNPILPMEEPFQIAQDGWDFMEDNRTFDSDMDFCNDFSEYDGELSYESSFCGLMEGLSRRESGSNLRPIKRADSRGEIASENASSTLRSAQQLCGDADRIDGGVSVVATVQDVEGRVQHVSHASTDSGGPATPHSATSAGEDTGNKRPERLRLPLAHTAEPYPQTRSHTRSPSSPSLAGVFNTSFPASNSLQSMSPLLSPASSKKGSPPLNHRIVLLSDKDVDSEQDVSSNADEYKMLTEVVDKNGNQRTVSRLDLNLNRRPSNSKWNTSSNSTTTGESPEISPLLL